MTTYVSREPPIVYTETLNRPLHLEMLSIVIVMAVSGNDRAGVTDKLWTVPSESLVIAQSRSEKSDCSFLFCIFSML